MIKYIKIHNAETGEIIEREMNEEELAQLQAIEERVKLEESNAKALEELKKNAKAKLIAGEPLTAEEAETLVL